MINKKTKKGFLLIELMVSMSVFTVIMLIVAGSIISVLDANSRNQNKKIALDNLNYVIESMSRDIRYGTTYRCSMSGDLNQPLNCATGFYAFAFKDSNNNNIIYTSSSNKIIRSINGGSWQDVTSNQEIIIEGLYFRVVGALPYGSDYLQPMVIVNVSGYVGSEVNTRSYFDLQFTVSQRKLDI